MKIKLILFFVLTIVNTTYNWAQEKNDSNIKKNTWSYTLGLGMNTTSRDTKHASLITPNFSFGVIRNFHSEKLLHHGLQVKLSFYRESLKQVPFYKLNAANILESTTMSQTNTHPMLYVGWLSKYMIKKEKVFIQAGLGFNFMFLSTYKRKFEDGTTGVVRVIWPPKDFFVTRPELSLGVGFIKKFSKVEFTFKPNYAYNFTIGNLNLIPSFHSLSLDTFIKF